MSEMKTPEDWAFIMSGTSAWCRSHERAAELARRIMRAVYDDARITVRESWGEWGMSELEMDEDLQRRANEVLGVEPPAPETLDEPADS